jgi:hypothetical protein
MWGTMQLGAVIAALLSLGLNIAVQSGWLIFAALLFVTFGLFCATRADNG